MKIEYSDKRSKIDKVVAGLQREKKREREKVQICVIGNANGDKNTELMNMKD